MRHYETDSRPAATRLLAVTVLADGGLELDPMKTTFFLGRETILATPKPGLARWRKRLFGFMSRNAQQATAYFRLPPNRVVELGSQIVL